MVQRIVTSIIGLPILILAVAIGGVVLQGGILLVALVGMYEMYHAMSKRNLPLHAVGYGFAVLYVGVLPWMTQAMMMGFLVSFIIALMMLMVVFHEKVDITQVTTTFFGFFYVAVLISFIYMVRSHVYGQLFVWLIFISAWGSDTFAYFSGLLLGRHKLCPKLSPKKTVEGAIGGVVGAVALGILYGLAVNRWTVADDIDIVLFFSVISGVCAVFSQFGDLAASAVKRSTGIKDFGHLIPGHGGVLDRCDSLLFTAPGVYLVLVLMLKFLA